MSEEPCTDCGDTGITYQTERRCACQPEPTRPAANVEAEPVADLAAKVWLDICTRFNVTITLTSGDGNQAAAAVIASALEQVRKDVLEEVRQAGDGAWQKANADNAIEAQGGYSEQALFLMGYDAAIRNLKDQAHG